MKNNEWNPISYMVPVELKNVDGSLVGPARIEFLPPLEVTLEQRLLSSKGLIAADESVSEESDDNAEISDGEDTLNEASGMSFPQGKK